MSAQQAPGPGNTLQVTVHGHPNADTLLLWHPDVRTRSEDVAALATRIAGRGGFRVVVPLWDDGRDLLRSVRYARESAVHRPDDLAVIGYGAAGVAALGLALHQRRLGIGLQRITCVDAGPGLTDPISGQPLPDPVPARPEQATTKVDVIAADGPPADPAVAWAGTTTAAWQAAGWEATLVRADQFSWRLQPRGVS